MAVCVLRGLLTSLSTLVMVLLLGDVGLVRGGVALLISSRSAVSDECCTR